VIRLGPRLRVLADEAWEADRRELAGKLHDLAREAELEERADTPPVRRLTYRAARLLGHR
jgi:hypothetical protein